jgi:hypothetical protein
MLIQRFVLKVPQNESTKKRINILTPPPKNVDSNIQYFEIKTMNFNIHFGVPPKCRSKLKETNQMLIQIYRFSRTKKMNFETTFWGTLKM